MLLIDDIVKQINTNRKKSNRWWSYTTDGIIIKGYKTWIQYAKQTGNPVVYDTVMELSVKDFNTELNKILMAMKEFNDKE